jgi:hypothetical protein
MMALTCILGNDASRRLQRLHDNFSTHPLLGIFKGLPESRHQLTEVQQGSTSTRDHTLQQPPQITRHKPHRALPADLMQLTQAVSVPAVLPAAGESCPSSDQLVAGIKSNPI